MCILNLKQSQSTCTIISDNLYSARSQNSSSLFECANTSDTPEHYSRYLLYADPSPLYNKLHIDAYTLTPLAYALPQTDFNQEFFFSYAGGSSYSCQPTICLINASRKSTMEYLFGQCKASTSGFFAL